MTINDLMEFYSARLEDMPELALVLDQEGTPLFANRAMRKVQNAPVRDFAPQDIAEQLKAEAGAEGFALLGAANPPIRETRLRVILPDGAGTRHVNWKFVAIPATDGAIILTWGTFRATGAGQEMGFTVSPSGIIQAASPALCDVCGYSKDELVGRPARQFYYSASSRKRIVNQLNERSEVENGAVTLRCKDGSPLTLWYSAESIRDKQGRIQAYSGYFQQRPFPFSSKLASEFSHIVDALPDLAWVCGRDLRIVAANQAYLQAYGRTRDEVVGRTEYDFLDPAHARFPIEAALKVFEEKQELLHPAVPHLLNPQIWYRVIRRPIFDDDRQEVIGLLGIAQDISAKVLQENAFMDQLRVREDDVVVVTDDQGRILRRSAQTLSPSIYGRPEAFEAYTLDMRPVLELMHPDDLPLVRQATHLALREHREQHLECRIRNQAGNYSTILARLVYNEAIYGEPRMYVVVRDISEQVGLRKAAMVIERLKLASGSRTDRELASFLNVSAAAISNARKNERVPSDWLIDTGLRTGQSIDWLVCGTVPSQT
jgi:PAS domain S-box-containing protein